MANNTITIADVGIRIDAKGRYCLNDLHKAAGGERKHGPSLWLENQQTKDLTSALASEATDAGNPVSVIKGGVKQGTYVAKELVYAYAMWISPSFHLKVIRAYDKAMADAGDWRKLRHAAASTSKVLGEILQQTRAEIGKATAAHHYMNEHKLVNSLLTGEYRGLNRESLSTYQLDLLAHLELRNAVLIGTGMPYEQRKGALKAAALDFSQQHVPQLAKPTKEVA